MKIRGVIDLLEVLLQIFVNKRNGQNNNEEVFYNYRGYLPNGVVGPDI